MSENQYQLVVRKGPVVGEIIPLDLPIVTVGRDPVSDAVINDPEISRQHTRFIRSPSGFTVQDLGSTNGTFVNGDRIGGEPVELISGQTISMGSGVTLLYEVILPETADLEQADDDVDEFSLYTEDEVEQDPADAFFYAPAEQEDSSPSYEAPAYEPPASEPVSYNAYDDPSATTTGDEENKSQRNMIIAIAMLFFILCCCCSFLTFMWFYGGDWLLEQMGLI